MNIINIDPNACYFCSPNVSSTGFTSLMYLVNNTRDHPEYLDRIKYILDNYPDELDKRNTEGWTALMIACRNTNTSSTINTVELLLKYNPDVNASNDDLENILSITISYSNTDSSYRTVELLLDHGADITQLLRYEQTILHRTYIHDLQVCNINAVKLLIDRSPKNIFLTHDYFGDTPFMAALHVIYKYDTDLNYELIKYFLDYTPIEFSNNRLTNMIVVKKKMIPNRFYKLLKDYQDTSLDVKCALD